MLSKVFDYFLIFVLNKIIKMKLKQATYKKLLLIAMVLSYCLPSYSQTNLIGKWVDTDHKEKQIEIYTANNNKIYGKSEKGFIVLKDFVYDIKSDTYTGILVNPEDKEEFKITIKQPSINKFTFVVRKFIFSKKFIFEKMVNN
jgi:hypothetical protein